MALPYPRFLLEVPASAKMAEPFHTILDVTAIRGGLRFDMYVAESGPRRGSWRLMPGNAEIIDGNITARPDILLPARDQQGTIDALTKMAAVLLCYLAVRDCPAVTTARQEAPEKLNCKRIAQRRSPVPPVHVVTVVLPKERPERGMVSDEAVGAEPQARRRSPVAHWRAGHLRRKADGGMSRIPLSLISHQPGQPVPQMPKVRVVTGGRRGRR